ncbi:hypothetical protein, partial [Thermanaerothrix sp.]
MAEIKPPSTSHHRLILASLLLCLILGLGVLRATLLPTSLTVRGSFLLTSSPPALSPESTDAVNLPASTSIPVLSTTVAPSGVVVLALSDGPFIH